MWAAMCAVLAAVAVSVEAQSQMSLGSVRIPTQVTANGQALAAGTYTLRVSADAVAPVVGQTPSASKWIEFVQGGQVKGKEIATVATADDVKQIAEMTPPAAGTAKVQTLKGADYVRVWINHGGTHYLLHLMNAAPSTAKK
jgi:hypothetical protein